VAPELRKNLMFQCRFSSSEYTESSPRLGVQVAAHFYDDTGQTSCGTLFPTHYSCFLAV
jgi:hypothetical protein